MVGIEIEPAKLWIWIEDLAQIDDNHQEALSRQTMGPSTFDGDSAVSSSTKQPISTTYQYTGKGSQEVVMDHLDVTRCEGNFSGRGLTIQGRSSLESGDLVKKINDNEFIVLRKESSQFIIMGKARRKVLVPVSGKRRLNPSVMLWMDFLPSKQCAD
ncbi:hypothetical protein BDZ45DRAFT_746246 [Acephala macrosclerotiorum]|nr:hypothetical protein BDZ45DRAFT_746246 [Acephala macrosclerotiorum]